MKYENKVGIVTGATGVLGRAIVDLYIKKGANLVLVDKDQEALNNLQESYKSTNKILAVNSDVSCADSVKSYVNKTLNKFNRIDFLINNAGVEGKLADLHEISEECYQYVMDVNVRGVFNNMKYVLPFMKKRNSGAIINIASDAGNYASPGLSAYVASKHAVIGLTKSAAIEYGAWNVRTNSVCPGSIDSRMMDSIQKMYSESSTFNDSMKPVDYKGRIPMNRFGKPEEIAELVCFLTSSQASFINGGVYYIDGGKTAW